MTYGKTGFTTGSCAAAAAKAAAMMLCGISAGADVDIGLPDGTRARLPVETVAGFADYAEASVRKDAGDDPDVTHMCVVAARVEWHSEQGNILLAGNGVGTVTKPGLSVAPDEPAINPVPRRMIQEAVREVTDRSLKITISIPGGEELAKKTFNPRLGIRGGLSILGTSGIVRPFSSTALRDALKCALTVAGACNVASPVFVPGRIGERAARMLLALSPEQLIEVSNEWEFVLDEAVNFPFRRLMLLGHPGKLAKLMLGWWDTHSSRSGSAVPGVLDLAQKVLGYRIPDSRTVEGIFTDLPPDDRRSLANALAAGIRIAVTKRLKMSIDITAVLVNMQGELLGLDGDAEAWEWKIKS